MRRRAVDCEFVRGCLSFADIRLVSHRCFVCHKRATRAGDNRRPESQSRKALEAVFTRVWALGHRSESHQIGGGSRLSSRMAR